MKTKYLLFIGFIIFIIAAICSEGFLHPDEHFQLFEFAHYKMGEASAEYLPWEFNEKMRPTLQVFIIYNLSVALKSAGIFDPYIVAMILRLGTAILMFYVLYLFYKRYKNELQTEKGSWWFAALLFLLWYTPYISVRYSSEAWSTMAILAALLAYPDIQRQKINTGRFFLVGFLLGLSFIIRFQMGFMIAGFGLWALIIKREKIVPVSLLASGLVTAIGIGLLCDYWFYGEWVSSAYNYFYQNLVENKAAGFGVSPVWYYISLTPLLVFPVLGLIVVPAFIIFFYRKPKHIFTWMLLPFLLVHHLIGHKELRFLFPVAPFIPFIIVAAMENVKWIKRSSWIKYIFWAINIPALLIMSLKPAYDNMGVYRYLYYHQPNTEVYYMSSSTPFIIYQYELYKRPFRKGLDLKMTFFHRPGFYPHPMPNTDTLITVVKSSDKPVVLVVNTIPYERIYAPELLKAGIHTKILYHTYHNWIMFLNYKDWINRPDVGAWTIVELSR